MEGYSQIEMIFFRNFLEQFSDLFSVRAKITNFEQTLIQHSKMIIWQEGYSKEDMKIWQKNIRAANNLLNQGALVDRKSVFMAYLRIAERISIVLNQCLDSRKKAKEADLFDDFIEAHLAQYKTIYEGLLTLIFAPIVFAGKLAKNINDNSLVPGRDGRISLNAVSKIEKYLDFREKVFSIGINNHVRNAYAHQKYRILDGGKFEIWDKNWGPELWDYKRIEKLCDSLWLNALSIVCALSIFSINNRKQAEELGWISLSKIPKLRYKELKVVIEKIADRRCFDLLKFGYDGHTILLELSTRPKGIDQEAIVYAGSSHHVKRYKISMKYVERPVIVHALGFCQELGQYCIQFDGIKMTIYNYDKQKIGDLSIDYKNIEKISSIKDLTVEEARKLFSVDTIDNAKMHFLLQSLPRED